MTMLTAHELCVRYKITRHFIKTHPELGGIGRPKVYDQERVEAVLRELDGRAAGKKPPAVVVPPIDLSALGPVGNVYQLGDIPNLRQQKEVRHGKAR